jgi:hypothetical protein
MIAVNDSIAAGQTEITRNPKEIRRYRRRLGDLIVEALESVNHLEKWNAGAMNLARAAEVRRAKETRTLRNMLRLKHLAACQELGVDPLTDNEWLALWPTRRLFFQDFETDADWDGSIETQNTPEGTGRCLAGEFSGKYYARRTRVGIYYNHARAATNTWVKFKYYVNRPGRLTVMVFDLTQKDNYHYRIDRPVVGQWTEVALNVTEDFKRNDGSDAKVDAGDAIDDIFILGGARDDKGMQLFVDDVELIGQD